MANVKNTLLQLDDIFSAPLIATINADMQVSESIIRLITQIGFEEGDRNKLRMLSFAYHASDGDVTSIEVPLLSLIPLPMLNISRADFQFDVEVFSYYEVQEAASISLLGDESPAVDARPCIKANFAKSQGNTSSRTSNNISTTELNAKMNVSIQMQQADLPGGMSNLLNLMNNLVLKEDK